ncbi:MAG: hypothetical protein Q4E67_03205 [Planctomycetia bacterium]|nr:hypothetical protein [Planctomycetia bacterium]
MEMTPGGWLCMILAISTVTSLFGWCCWKVLSPPGKEIHATSEFLMEDWKAHRRKRRRQRQKRLEKRSRGNTK